MSAGQYEVRRVHGSGKYAVFNAAGERVSSPANHDVALTVAQNLAKGQGRKLRPCLTCGGEFVIRDLWSPDRCPVALLPWLAWALSVDQWDRRWPETTKRAVIRDSIRVHRAKGSRAAVGRALAALGFPDAEIVEGSGASRHDGRHLRDGSITYARAASWATYRVILSRPVTLAQAELVRAALATVAPARSHLAALDFTEAVALHDGTITRDGTMTYGVA